MAESFMGISSAMGNALRAGSLMARRHANAPFSSGRRARPSGARLWFWFFLASARNACSIHYKPDHDRPVVRADIRAKPRVNCATPFPVRT